MATSKQKSDFSNIARLYSEGYERDTGGFIGPRNLANIHPFLKVHSNKTKSGLLYITISTSTSVCPSICVCVCPSQISFRLNRLGITP